MKLFLALSLFFSLSANAKTFNAKVDLTKLSGGYSAGTYDVTVETRALISIAQSQLETDFSYEEGHCVSTLNFPVGVVEVTVKNPQGQVVTVENRTVTAGYSVVAYVESEKECERNPEKFVGTRQVSVVAVRPSVSYELPIQVPEFKDVVAEVSPFSSRNAVSMVSSADIKYNGRTYTLDPQHVLDIATAKTSTNKMVYRVTATNPGQIYSLANRETDLVPVK